MNNLAQSEVFSLTLVIGTYLASLALYRKTRISLRWISNTNRFRKAAT